MFGLGADRKILRIYLQRRLLLAGAHAARPRHPCRLRPVEIGDREIVGARAAGAARHGDDGLAMTRRSVLVVIACDKREAFAQGSVCDKAIHPCSPLLDCCAEPVIGRRFAPTRWLAMTTNSVR